MIDLTQDKKQTDRDASGFDKLRLARPAVAAAAAAAGVGLAGPAAGVTIPANGTDVTFGGVFYEDVASNNTVDVPITSLPGATGDSAYGLATDASTASGTDAFDDFGGITVNGVSFNQPTGMIDFTTTADGGFFTTLTPADIGGIETSLDFFLDDSSPTARVFATFTNNNSTTETAVVAYGGDLGSDNNTTIEDTSTGDTTFESTLDRYLISSDGVAGDPVLTFVRFGPGGQVASSTPAVPGEVTAFGLDELADIWTLSLEPGETQSLLWYVQFNPSVADAQAGTADFANLATLDAAGLTAGLTQQQVDQTVNWTAIPEPSSIVLMAAVIGAVGWARLRSWWKK